MFYADRKTDGHTNMTKLIVAFRNLEKAFENVPNRNVAVIALILFQLFVRRISTLT